MGKLYTINVRNTYTDDCYNVTQLGDTAQEVHKDALYKCIRHSDIIDKIYTSTGFKVFDDSTGFIDEINLN
jgi:hypothetical protein